MCSAEPDILDKVHIENITNEKVRATRSYEYRQDPRVLWILHKLIIDEIWRFESQIGPENILMIVNKLLFMLIFDPDSTLFKPLDHLLLFKMSSLVSFREIEFRIIHELFLS